MSTETTETIGRWSLETFGPGSDPKVMARRMMQEALELAYVSGLTCGDIDDMNSTACGKFFAEYISPKFSTDQMLIAMDQDIPGELADVAITVANMAHRLGIDLDAEVAFKMVINRARKWKSFGDGTGQHIKTEVAS